MLKNLLTKKTTRGSKDRSIEDEILLSSESENSIEEASVASLMKIGEKKKSTARVSSINNISIKNKNSRTSRTKSTKRIDDIDVDDFFLELMEEGDDDLPEIIDEGRNAGKKANQRSSRGSSSLTEEDIAEIQKLVNERDAARRLMDYDTADTVRGKIESEYGVKFYDHRGTWVAPDGTTGKYYTKQVVNTDNSGQGIPIVPAEQVACTMSFDEVQNLVFERTAARRARRFAEADDIRDELARNGIELHDNTNKWVSVDGKLTGYQSGDYDNYLSNISR